MSKLVNQSGLQQFATKLWAKIKGRYDVAFKNAEISPSAGDEKHITFGRINGQDPLQVSLADYARLQDRNEFKQDVSADNVGIANNSHIGTETVFDSRNRSVGFRQLTTSAFADGYVDHIKIYVESADTNTNSTWTVWAITKDANDKAQDRVKKVICDSATLPVNSITEGTETKKFVKIPVEASFELETYFIARCSTHKLQVIRIVKPEYSDDSINMNASQPTTPGSSIDWNSGDNTPNNTAIMHLVGRESIGSLALKLKQTQADGSKYVLKSETTTTSEADKVVRLDGDGKINSNMLPSIAINEYIEVATFDHTTLQGKRFENGDVVVVTNGGVVTKRYLCIDKEHNKGNLVNAFVELNSKDGVVQSVNGKVGAVTLRLEADDEKFKLKINGTGGAEVVEEIPMISEQDITNILDSLPQ